MHHRSVVKLLKMMQRLVAVEHLDVMTLRRSQAPHCPAQVNEVRLDRCVQRVHSNLARQTVRLARIAGAAGCDHVRPVIAAAA